jgi:hypothetical protein
LQLWPLLTKAAAVVFDALKSTAQNAENPIA